MIPSVIVAIQEDELDYSDKRIIREAFRNEEIPYKIENYELVNIGATEDDSYEVSIINNLKVIFVDDENIERYPLSEISLIVLTKSSVYHVQSIVQTKLFDYADYEKFENLDLSQATNDDQDFWNIVFSVTNEQLDIFSNQTLAINIIKAFVTGAFGIIFFSLLITFFQRMILSEIIKFSKLWQLMIYLMTPYVIAQLFAQLFLSSAITFIGTILTIIYANRLSQILLKDRKGV